MEDRAGLLARVGLLGRMAWISLAQPKGAAPYALSLRELAGLLRPAGGQTRPLAGDVAQQAHFVLGYRRQAVLFPTA